MGGEEVPSDVGGPTGLRASGPVSRILMDYWIDQLLQIAKNTQMLKVQNPVKYGEVKIHLATKYVDDVFTALEAIKPDMRFAKDDKALVWDPELDAEDKKETEQERENSQGNIFVNT